MSDTQHPLRGFQVTGPLHEIDELRARLSRMEATLNRLRTHFAPVGLAFEHSRQKHILQLGGLDAKDWLEDALRMFDDAFPRSDKASRWEPD